ncbi:hypothetical protein C8J56DRAFT_1048511 [Mycena floridula]|nr:hypothetical protein C8J56DRAFT_1048511 [Mycena floridula]
MTDILMLSKALAPNTNLTVKGMIPVGNVTTYSTYNIPWTALRLRASRRLLWCGVPNATEPVGQRSFFNSTIPKAGQHMLVIAYTGGNTYILGDVIVFDTLILHYKKDKVGPRARSIGAVVALLVISVIGVVLYR